MDTLSRTAERCRECPNVKNCDNKRLEAFALAELPKQATTNSNLTIGSSAMQSNTQFITITPTISDETINSTIEKITKLLMINSCYFK